MTPLLNNLCSMQMEFMNQWYKSFDTTFRSLTNVLEYSPPRTKQVSNQNQDNIVPDRTIKKSVKTGLAVVTGGIGGIGTEICKRLSTDGNRIIATHIAAETDKAAKWKLELESEGYAVEVYECDVADFESCRLFAEKVKEKFGPVDILVNAAGITRDAMLRKMDPDKWHAVIDTNLDSVFNVTRNFIDGMLKNKYGRIINISSVNGQKGQFGQTNYSTAKAGMIGFTRSLALELADKGITVNSVCPGYVHTSMVAAIREDVLESIIKQIPVGRLASVTEIADAVAFLAKKESAYITGTELAVNGGLWMG